MTNEQIIIREAINHKLYTEEEIEKMILNFEDIPLHTFAFWKEHGFMVKKGQHACIETKLWKLKKGTKKEEVANVKDPSEDTAHFYMCKSFLFHGSQVERMAV